MEQRDELLHARKVLGAERIVLGFLRDQLLKALEAIRANDDADGDVLREQAHSAIEAYEDDAKARRLGLRGEASTSASVGKRVRSGAAMLWIRVTKARISTLPAFANSLRATAPAATRPIVSRAEERPPPR